MIDSPVILINLKKIKYFNSSLDRQINTKIKPPLDGWLQMRLIAIFNKYWLGKMDIERFAKLWTRLIGPLETIKQYGFDQYIETKDVDFIDNLIISYKEPTIH